MSHWHRLLDPDEIKALKPRFEKVRAIDAKPYRWALWCTVGTCSEPFANTLVTRKWSEDGQRIWFMLDSHNFMDADPDDVLELVPNSDYYSAEFLAGVDERDSERMAQRPHGPWLPKETPAEREHTPVE